MGRRLGITEFDLWRLRVTGSLNVVDGGNGSEKLFSKIMIAEMKGGSPFVLVLLEFRFYFFSRFFGSHGTDIWIRSRT